MEFWPTCERSKINHLLPLNSLPHRMIPDCFSRFRWGWARSRLEHAERDDCRLITVITYRLIIAALIYYRLNIVPVPQQQEEGERVQVWREFQGRHLIRKWPPYRECERSHHADWFPLKNNEFNIPNTWVSQIILQPICTVWLIVLMLRLIKNLPSMSSSGGSGRQFIRATVNS